MNAYLQPKMGQFTPPTGKCPVNFLYAEDNSSFSIYGSNGLQLFGCTYNSAGQCTTATLYDNHGQQRDADRHAGQRRTELHQPGRHRRQRLGQPLRSPACPRSFSSTGPSWPG